MKEEEEMGGKEKETGEEDEKGTENSNKSYAFIFILSSCPKEP